MQRSAFSCEIDDLNYKKYLNEKNRLTSLDPFLDNDGILRIGGRIRRANISF